ncbi:hypothetical protein [Pseudofrankia asymbiotica]|uniref:Uncharacterized protein n=1 Tax=Pseudofrankia asymbiotica TaxID=1834516 RepID=A0A1V2IH24_9ACTN|nr:hypothetical protein [Pseudofrankia asymbiotica]ONH32290.1 hypothetical protein BL253_06140 [Pseudofrankia asymbiotica]
MADERTAAVEGAHGRAGLAHEARLRLAPGADKRAPGGAVTIALCGHWEHDGPCRWPHHTSVGRPTGGDVTIRVVAVSPPSEHAEVRRLIEGALAAGALDGPTGLSHWSVLRSGPTDLTADEQGLADRLATTPRPAA